MFKLNMNKLVAASYKFDLDLLRASRIRNDIERDHLIQILTLTAYEDISYGQTIVDIIRDQMEVVSTQSQMLIIALVMAIVSSVGGEYKKLLNKHITEIFMAAFVRADSVGRMKLYEMRDKWDFYFSKEALHELDCAAKKIDCNWPIIPARPKRLEMFEKDMAMQAEIQRLDKEKRILLAQIEKLEREAIVSPKQLENPKIIKQNQQKICRGDQIAEFKTKWNGYQPSIPLDLKIDIPMDSHEDPYLFMFASAEQKFCKSTDKVSSIITPPPDDEKAGKLTVDNNSFWMKAKSLTEKSPSLFFENISEFVI